MTFIWVVVALLVGFALLSTATAFLRGAVFEDGRVIAQSDEPGLFRLIRARLVLQLLAILFSVGTLANSQGLVNLPLGERFYLGLFSLAGAGVIGIWLKQGFLIGEMQLGLKAKRGQPDFWVIASIFAFLSTLLAILGLFLVTQAIL